MRTRKATLRLLAATAVAVVAASAVADVAAAQSGTILRGDAPSRSRSGLPDTGRYVSEAGQSFVLDRSGPRTLMRFERSNEVWVLRPQPAPRGDVILRNDAGDQVLRVTPDGNMTLYTASAPQGVPVSAQGSAARLLPPTLTAVQLANFIIHQSGRASSAVGRLVIIDVEIGEGGEAVAADAVATAVEAVVRMARSAGLRQDAGRVRRIVVTDQGRPRITFARGVLTIGIDPTAGYAGRPSSARIARVVSGVE
ncbi:DUF4908 domain-containing protein [Brevundimonas sp.]|uniref:DUF4908 domain-containing protein n=1 Tax=Brevundimonas sp. TaxID=1871086 RepID=UPI002E0E2127|nr:DUF4908 domain-containing protein [Brevundimonas sp.]